MAKKKKKCKECKERKYLGSTYRTVNTINVEDLPEILKAMDESAMRLDKCRMVVYGNINVGNPPCPPQGCS